MSIASHVPAGAVRLDDLVDAMALATGAWVVVEELGRVVCHGVGRAPCGTALAEALLTKRVHPLRDAVVWTGRTAPLSGTVDESSVTAVDLGEGGTAWFLGAAPSPEAGPALSAALRGDGGLLRDEGFATLLHPRGPSRSSVAPAARVLAISADVPLPALCRAVSAAVAGRAVRAHVEDEVVLLALDPADAGQDVVHQVACRCPGTLAGSCSTPDGAPDWRFAADVARAAIDAARDRGLVLADVDDPQVAAEVLVREATQAAAALEARLRSAPLQALAAHDDRSSGDLVPTLRAWCRAGFDIPAAAADLHVHTNTLRYRLKRASAVSGLALDQPRQRLALQLMLLA